MPSEKEIKLIARANTQIKFYNSNTYSDVTKKVTRLLSVMGAEITEEDLSSDRRKPTRRDVFFDHDWFLAERMHSASVRIYDTPTPKATLTVKLAEAKGNYGSIQYLDRNQYKEDLSEGDAEKFLRDGIREADLKVYFPDIDLDLNDDEVLLPKGDALIRRSIMRFKIGSENYSLYIDKFYFHDRVSDKFSETYVEVEIDCTNSKKINPALKQFIEVLQCTLDVEMQPVSKYQRFRDFCDSDQFEEFFFIGVDLVSYSQDASWKQKQIVQLFHKIIKDSVPNSTRATRPILISIGDGAIIAMPSDWSNIHRTIGKIKDGVDLANKQDDFRRIDFRVAVHFGSVFTFTDVNNGTNVAGEGINVVSRVLDQSSNGKCLISEHAFRRIVDANPINHNKFKCLGEIEFKHGLQLVVYEYEI